MDQDPTNGTSSDKRNWRERLGIGTRDMPKLSDEFKGPQEVKQSAAPAPRPAVKAPQPVTRPAPMAPRVAAPKPVATAPLTNGQPRPQGQPAGGNDVLAEKLRAQRAAAEKLAEQRVLAARERAEGRAPAEPSLPPGRPRQPEQSASTGAPRPKFSFADDSTPAAETLPPSRTNAGPLLPPRPALGGDRAQPPFLRPGSPPQTGYRSEPPPYRPIDPATGYPGTSRNQPPLRPYGSEPGGFAPGRLPQQRRQAYDPYAHAPQSGFDSEGYADEQPRLTRPPAPRGRARQFEPEPEDVFEDEPGPRRRASARDYQSAYQENEEGYEDERRRSSGPWLLLLALLVAALVTGGIVWYYNTKMKSAVVPAQSDSVPVIAAPEQAAKSAPETAPLAAGESPAAKKKQIYDRIIGEQEITEGQVLPTEELPVQPETAPAAAEATGEGVGQIPEPAGAVPEALEEPAPLPLPPPPEDDTQGSLDQSGAAKLAAAAAQDPPDLPTPKQVAEGAAKEQQASPPSVIEPAQDIAEKPVVKPAKAKAKAETATKKKVAAAAPAETENLGAEPVVLVPPSQAANPIQGGETTSAGISQPAPAPAPAKKKTLLDLFKSSDSTATAEPAAPTQQVAAVQPAQPAAPQPSATKKATAPAASTGSGYFIQLASFRTQSEAQSEYDRLQSSYSNIIGGLPSSITQATVAGSTRYRVGVGPLSSREQATKVCNSLFSAGERDCLVRTQ